MTDKEIFEKFIAYANSHGWTFEESAKNLGVSRASLFNWQNGKPISARPRKAMLLLITDPAKAIPPPNGDALLQYVITEWVNLSAEDRGSIIAIIETAKERKKTLPNK